MSEWKETEFGRIPSDWDYKPLENYFDLITYGFTNPMPTEEEGPFMLTAKDIFDGRIQYNSARRTSQEAYNTLLTNKSKPKINDVLITKDGSIGRVAIVEKEDMCISQSVALIRPNSKIKPLFLKYLLESPQYQMLIQRDAGGSTIEHVYITRINKMLVGVPEIEIQKAILDVIHNIQLKIDLLLRQNKTLEQLAEILFKQMFVGREWTGSLSEYIKVRGGYAFKSKDFKETGFAGIIKITNISMGFVDIIKSDFVDEIVVKNLDKKFKIKSGDFLIAMTGAEIGKIGIVENTEKELWVNQRVGKIEAKIPYGDIIGYMALKSREGQDHIINACSGSAQENISTTGIEEMIFSSYDSEKANAFGQQAQSLFVKIFFNLKQISTLTQIRDTLLPKLMSGEVRVKM
jgi:type I restriction enzyme S subunit